MLQLKCSRFRRQDHFEEQCHKQLSCSYCQGRFHTAQTCRVWLADRRHQDLVETVRLISQETLTFLRGTCNINMASAPLGRHKPLISSHTTLSPYHSNRVHSSCRSLYHMVTSRSDSRRQRGHCNKEQCIVSPSVRGFLTNVGELTNKFVLPCKADTVFVSETFFDSNMQQTMPE